MLKFHNVMVCKKCGYTRDIFWGSDRTQILNPTHCTKCGGELIDTGKTDDEWEPFFLEANPEIDPNQHNSIQVFNWISHLYLEGDPEALAKNEERIKAEEIANKRELEEWNRTPRCPKCGSSNLGRAKQGFKWGRAVAGAAITGFLDVGAAAGAIGSGKMVNVCNQCGHKWK